METRRRLSYAVEGDDVGWTVAADPRDVFAPGIERAALLVQVFVPVVDARHVVVRMIEDAYLNKPRHTELGHHRGRGATQIVNRPRRDGGLAGGLGEHGHRSVELGFRLAEPAQLRVVIGLILSRGAFAFAGQL